MTEDRTSFGRWVDRGVAAAIVFGVALAGTFGLLISSTLDRTAEEESRQEAVETILTDVQQLQECIIELLLIPSEVRVQLDREMIDTLCPPLVVLPVAPEDPETSSSVDSPPAPGGVPPAEARPPPAAAPAAPAPVPAPAPAPPPAPPPADPPAPPPEPPPDPPPVIDVPGATCDLTGLLC